VANVTKAELVSDVASRAGVSKVDAENILDAYFSSVVESAKRGDKTSWPLFGSFSVTRRAARIGRNPRTGETIPVPASNAIRFTASSSLKSALNPRATKAAGKKAAKKGTKKAAAKKAAKKKR
jgi:DNA-binding protein HU-beta